MSVSSRARPGRPRGSDHQELLAIARKLFIADGFRGTTMDKIAARAHISKQSLYRDFESKDMLYAAVVRDWVDQGTDAMRPHSAALAQADDVADALQRLADVLQGGLLSPAVLQMRTLVASEALRFPEVAADYVERSWLRNMAILADALTVLDRRGLLSVEHPRLAAEQFTWLVVAAPLNQLTLQGGAAVYTADDLRVLAGQGVATFLSRYGR